MIVKISKKGNVYTAFAAELVDIIAADSYLQQQYGTGECTDNDGAEFALDDFHNMLRDIIGWYKYEAKEMPEILHDSDNFTIQFDAASYMNCYYDHADTETYRIDETPEIDIKVKKKNTARADRYKAIFFPGHEKLSGDILVPDLKKADRKSPFYNKKVVFTGVLETVSRGDAAEIVKSMGADINTTISGSTDYVIMGANAGPAKMKKIEDCNKMGANIRIVYEPEFLEMIIK